MGLAENPIEEKAGPVKKLVAMLLAEKESLTVFLVYAVIISLLYLAIPLAAQVLVNTIAAGVLFQPLLLISLTVLIGLVFLGLLRIFQLYITEILQRKVFAGITLNLAEKIPQVKQKYFGDVYAPELVNRFFDTVTIQKALTLILLEVPASVLQIIVGIVLMGIYNPVLVLFDFALIAAVAFIYVLGFNGVRTSLAESGTKYRVAHWLEELARCQVSFKMNGNPYYLLAETDQRIIDYLQNRKKHFQVLVRQFSASFLIEAFASAGVLAIGGWLVIHGKLSLGQLVASELIILMVLSALDKVIQKLESWYDLLTAIEKVSFIDELETERKDGSMVFVKANGAELVCEDLVFSYYPERKIFEKVNLKLRPGSRTSLVGVSGSGKTTLACLISGLNDVQEGNILFNGLPIKSLNLGSLRENIALVSDFNEIFAGSVEKNITLDRAHLGPKDLRWVIELVELDRDIKQYPQGLQTELLSEGRNISLGQRQRILLARSIIDRPQLLILDEAFGGMDERTKLKIIAKIFDKDKPWTILNITHDAEVVARTDYIYLLEKGVIGEEGLTQRLVVDKSSLFSQLFPELCEMKQKGAF
ncbi:MAG: ATP-binding cassette domain-containing protein [Candidatus Melainabacteria bacterium]|nr:ATP-binding cassette domain-containing protein [Candidatus Melainabacteria bacterium]